MNLRKISVLAGLTVFLLSLNSCIIKEYSNANKWKKLSDEDKRLSIMSKEDIRCYSNYAAEKLYNQYKENPSGVEDWVRNLADKGTDKYFIIEELRSEISKKILANNNYYQSAINIDDKDAIEFAKNHSIKTILYVSANDENSATAEKNFRRRIEEYFIIPPDITNVGNGQFKVVFYGNPVSGTIESLISDNKKLTFQLVNKDATNLFNSAFNLNPYDSIDLDTDKFKKDPYTGRIDTSSIANFPADCSVYAEYKKDEFGLDVLTGFWAVNNEVVIDGSNVKAVYVGQNQDTKEIEVNFVLDSDGAVEFAQFTSANVGQMLAIVSDGAIRSAANIKGAIPGGNISLTGAFNRDEAEILKSVLTQDNREKVDFVVQSVEYEYPDYW